MLPLVLFMTLVGAVLGLRFRVFILVPVIAVAALAIALGHTVIAPEVPLVLAVVAVAVALQAGYLCGLLVRQAMAVARLPKTRLAPSNAKSRA
jgi:hypothetical protein